MQKYSMGTDTKNIKNREEVLVQKKQKPYYAPKLKRIGKMQHITMGGSPGINDSGSELTQDIIVF